MRVDVGRLAACAGKILPFVIVANLLGACGGSQDRLQVTKEEQKPLSNSAEIKTNFEDPVLVQVLIQGLSVFDFDGNPARVLFPASRHNVGIWQGTGSGTAFHWTDIDKYEPGGDEIVLSNAEIYFEGAHERVLSAMPGNPSVAGLPKNQEDARKISWIIPAEGLGDFTRLNPLAAGSQLMLKAGNLETCGLVHPPYELGKICRVRMGGSNLIRAAAEYVVFRFTVADSGDDYLSAQ
jgi:hypothetical protein